MKITQFIVLLFAFLIVAPSYGQKIKRVNVRVNYVSLPNQKLPDEHTTYSIRYNNPRLVGAVTMDGFTEVEENGHLNIVVNNGSYRRGNPIPKEVERTTKDKDGNVTKRWKEYWYAIPLSTSANYKIFDERDLEITRRKIEVKRTLETGKFRSTKERNDNFNASASTLDNTFDNMVCQEVKNALQAHLDSEYDYCVTYAFMEVQSIKKHSMEGDFKEAFELTKKVFTGLQATGSPAQAKIDLAPATDFWKEWVGEKPSGDKKAMTPYYAACHNLAFTSYYLDDFAAAEKFATLLLEAKGKDTHCKALLKRIERLREKMEIHGVKTVHHTREL